MNTILTQLLGKDFLTALSADIAGYQDLAWGGFGQPPGANDLDDTYMSVGALVMLQSHESCRLERVVEYLSHCQNFDGGFGAYPSSSSSSAATQQALAILSVLGSLNAIDQNRTVEWLACCQQQVPLHFSDEIIVGGCSAAPPPRLKGWRQAVTAKATYEILASASLLGVLNEDVFNLEAALSYAIQLGIEPLIMSSDPFIIAQKKFDHYQLASCRLLDFTIDSSDVAERSAPLETRLDEIMGNFNDYTDHDENLYEVYFLLCAYSLLTGTSSLTGSRRDALLQALTSTISVGDPRANGTTRIGIPAIPYFGTLDKGGEIYPRTNFVGLGIALMMNGVDFNPQLGFPLDSDAPPILVHHRVHGGTHYSCFVSYSSNDQDFADRLHADLLQAGVVCWFAPEDLEVGSRLRISIRKAIEKQEKVIVILSETANRKPWVADEVRMASEEEERRKESILIPISIDSNFLVADGWVGDLREDRKIADWSTWKTHDNYRKLFDKLLHQLEHCAL